MIEGMTAPAQLRVYEPLAAFPDAERAHWSAYATAGQAPDRNRSAALERAAVLRALAALPPALVDEPGQALVSDLDGVTLVCPLRARVRAAEALVEWRGTLHEELADAFLPRAVADAAVEELHAWQEAHPDLRTHVLSSTWSVPLRWFVLVEADERTVSLGEGSVRTGRELVYRTAMSRARRRTARTLAVLRRTLGDEGVVGQLEDLGRWLEEFHPRSLVELDYGGLVHLLGDDELVQDESARDVAEAVAALGDGDTERASRAYARVTERMKALQAVESAN
ncbi:MAG: hypothetical protein JWM64_2111 [Frankiales bacterium]|nr:hypothetical protein [Frankiales bacterium]